MSSGERPELVLTYANEAGTAWVTNLVLSLRSVGVDHSLIVTPSAAHCSALFSSPARLSCGHTSWEVPAMPQGQIPRRIPMHSVVQIIINLMCAEVSFVCEPKIIEAKKNNRYQQLRT